MDTFSEQVHPQKLNKKFSPNQQNKMFFWSETVISNNVQNVVKSYHTPVKIYQLDMGLKLQKFKNFLSNWLCEVNPLKSAKSDFNTDCRALFTMWVDWAESLLSSRDSCFVKRVC